MTELGNRLKEARLTKGLSLDDVQSITKIQKRYLVGIEEGNYTIMPGNFYVRAFIKQYAEALDLNPEEIFETYKNEIPASYNEELPQQLSRVKSQKKIPQGNSQIFDALPKILIGVFVLGVASLVYVLVTTYSDGQAKDQVNDKPEQVNYVKSDNLEKEKEEDPPEVETNDQKSANAEKGTNTNDEVDNMPAQEEIETPLEEAPKQEVTVVQSAGRKTTYSLANANQFVVKVVSRGESWISIKNGKGKSFYSGTLKAGAADTFTADLSTETEAVIVVGRTLDADIYVNDQKLEYAVAPTEKVRQDITIQYVPKNE